MGDGIKAEGQWADAAFRFAAMVKQKEEEARTGSLSDLTTPGSND